MSDLLGYLIRNAMEIELLGSCDQPGAVFVKTRDVTSFDQADVFLVVISLIFLRWF